MTESSADRAPAGACACGRPDALCVCPAAPVVDNRVAVLILQHPQEQDRVLGTARMLERCLSTARVTVGLSWRNLGHAAHAATEQAAPDPRQWGVLYLGAGKACGRRWWRSTARANRWPTRRPAWPG